MIIKSAICLLISVVSYALLIVPFSSYLKNRPLNIKMGYFPDAKVVRYAAADQRYIVADWAILKVLFYFGSLIEKAKGKDQIYAAPPDYPAMFRTLQTALRLEPYNMDAYYFAQAAFTWELGRYKEVNNLLDYGMKYRTWDYQLPFFAGFNAAYFMKDYPKAAEYMKRAAELSGEQLFATLASRYFYEARNTDLAIAFIDVMKNSAKDVNEKRLYEVRRQAMQSVKKLESAAQIYHASYGTYPSRPSELVAEGLIESIPSDPYGGEFYFDQNGVVRSTSKFAFAQQQSIPRDDK
jgi:hypothetical protein